MRVSCLHQLVCYIRDPKDSVLRDSVYDPARLPSHPLHHHLQRHSRGGTNRTLRPRKCVLTTGDIVLRRQLRSVFSSLRTPSSFVFSFSISQSLACGSPLSATHPSWARRTGLAPGTLQHLYPTFGRNQSGYSFFFGEESAERARLEGVLGQSGLFLHRDGGDLRGLLMYHRVRCLFWSFLYWTPFDCRNCILS
jgi:hypothetical protein